MLYKQGRPAFELPKFGSLDPDFSLLIFFYFEQFPISRVGLSYWHDRILDSGPLDRGFGKRKPDGGRCTAGRWPVMDWRTGPYSCLCFRTPPPIDGVYATHRPIIPILSFIVILSSYSIAKWCRRGSRGGWEH